MNPIPPLARFIRSHFSRLATRGKWAFLWRAWLEAVLLAWIVANLAQSLFPAGPRHDLAAMPVFSLFALVLLIGPLTETIACQFLPLEFAAALRVRRSLRLALSVVPFALLHRFAGVPTVAAAGVVGGFYFAFAYERWRQESVLVGIGMTFLLHSSFNLVAVLGMLAFPR